MLYYRGEARARAHGEGLGQRSEGGFQMFVFPQMGMNMTIDKTDKLHKNEYGKYIDIYCSSAKTPFVLTPFGSR